MPLGVQDLAAEIRKGPHSDSMREAKMAVLSHLASLLAPVDSMLRSHPTQTQVVSGDSLAHAQSDTICFGREALWDLAGSSDDLRGLGVRLAAANYRAVAAADLNVTSDLSPFRQARTWAEPIRNAFYAAEVGRLETQYSGVYSSLQTIFEFDVASVLSGMLKQQGSERVKQAREPKMVLAGYAMVALRPYLDLNLFNQLYEAALEAGHEEAVLDEIAKLGEEFVKLSWPNDAETGRRIASRLAELVEFPEDATPECHMRGQSSKQDGSMKEKGAQAGKDAADSSNEPQEADDNGDQSDQDGQGEGEGQEGDGDGQNGSKSTMDQVRDMLDKMGSKARSSKENSRLDKMTEEAAEAAGVGIDKAAFTHQMVPVSNEARSLRSQLTSVFMELIEQTAGGVSYGTRRGKMVPLDRRMGRRRFRSTVTSNRRNELSIDVAILIDTSGSMSGYVQELGEAVWAIKGGVDDVAARARGLAQARVWSYNYGASLLMAEVKRTNPNLMIVPAANGGTSPVEALELAKKWMAGTSSRNRMLVMLTDGQWDGDVRAEKLISEIHQLSGSTSVLFGLGQAVKRYGDHGFRHAIDITKLNVMPVATRNIIRKSLKDRVGV